MTKVEISHKTIFFITAFIFSLWLVFQIKDIIFLLFISFVFMAGLRPIVDLFERIKIPRAFAIVITYILMFVLFGLVSSLLFPPLISETARFVSQLGSYLDKTIPFLQLHIQEVIPQIGPLSQNIFRVTIGVFSNIITLFTLLVFTFYLLLERKHLSQFLNEFVGERSAIKIKHVIVTIEHRIGGWIRGQLALMIIIGIAVYIGLLILRIPFALPLAIIAGLLEVVPNIGPIISAIPAIVVALKASSNPLLVLAIISLYFIIQQIENSVVVPVIMRKVVGLPPLVTIVALLVGGRLGGVPGILFSVPFVLVIQSIANELWIEKGKSIKKRSS